MAEIRFCSECKYAKEAIFEDGIKIFCLRVKNPDNVSATIWSSTFQVCKKLNAQACQYFEEKDVTSDR
ncbi:MAG: hypothetical protein MJZ37_00690 [Bacilli bacterium]|nr:hypothetical protein [Bacilli bacterium]